MQYDHGREKYFQNKLEGPCVQQGVQHGERSPSNGQVSYHVWQEALRPGVI